MMTIRGRIIKVGMRLQALADHELELGFVPKGLKCTVVDGDVDSDGRHAWVLVEFDKKVWHEEITITLRYDDEDIITTTHVFYFPGRPGRRLMLGPTEADEDVCRCDIKALMLCGHDAGCPEKR